MDHLYSFFLGKTETQNLWQKCHFSSKQHNYFRIVWVNFLFLEIRQLSFNSAGPIFLILSESLMNQLVWEMVCFPANLCWWKNLTVHLPAEHCLWGWGEVPPSCSIQLLMPSMVLMPGVLPAKTPRRFWMMVRCGIFYFSSVTESVLWEVSL